jgi:ubiquinone biosynthesis monooxygenase Coq7
MATSLSPLDRLLASIDSALRTVAAPAHASRPLPAREPDADAALGAEQRREAAALMRVNHVGEVCAQALYQAQALSTSDPHLREQFEQAAREETDHLAWTRERIDELGDRPSLLNPLWYAGAFGIGLIAGRLGDRTSLGFVVETERQVEAHLASHLERLPAADARSRQIVEMMKVDEAAHADRALSAGARQLPPPLPWLMRAAAKVMTTAAHRV